MIPDDAGIGPPSPPSGENDGEHTSDEEEHALEEITDAVNTEAAVHEGKRGGRWHPTTVSRVLRQARSAE